MNGEDPLQSAGPMIIVPTIEEPVLPSDDAHHLRKVLRLRSGAPIVVCDGEGRWRSATLGEDDAVQSLGDVVSVPAPSMALSVGFALIKEGKPELVCQKLTELGVDRIIAFEAERSVVNWSQDKRAKQLLRLGKVARQAALQCRRTRLPVIELARSLPECLEKMGPGAVVADRSGERWPPSGDHEITGLIVGPEGGWGNDEVPPGVGTVRIAQHMLRAETAAIAAGVSLTALRGIVSTSD